LEWSRLQVAQTTLPITRLGRRVLRDTHLSNKVDGSARLFWIAHLILVRTTLTSNLRSKLLLSNPILDLSEEPSALRRR